MRLLRSAILVHQSVDCDRTSQDSSLYRTEPVSPCLPGARPLRNFPQRSRRYDIVLRKKMDFGSENKCNVYIFKTMYIKIGENYL